MWLTVLPRSRKNWQRSSSSYKLAYGSLRVTGTTRRLVAYVTDLAPLQADEIVEKRGPSIGPGLRRLGAAHQGVGRFCPWAGRRGRQPRSA